MRAKGKGCRPGALSPSSTTIALPGVFQISQGCRHRGKSPLVCSASPPLQQRSMDLCPAVVNSEWVSWEYVAFSRFLVPTEFRRYLYPRSVFRTVELNPKCMELPRATDLGTTCGEGAVNFDQSPRLRHSVTLAPRHMPLSRLSWCTLL